MADEKPFAQFDDAEAFLAFLSAAPAGHPGIWMRIAKKSSGVTTVSYDTAVDCAITHGWIDGQKKPLDDDFYLQAFSPRRPRGPWSKRNVEKANRMIADGSMRPAGLAQVDAAKADGRWDRAYEGSSTSEPPADFLEALKANPAAKEFYATINSANRFAIYYRLQDAMRPETRARRIALYVEMLGNGETLH